MYAIRSYYEVQGKVNIFMVDGITRKNGVLQYRVSQGGVMVEELMPAQQRGSSVVLSVPFVGVWVRTLQNGLGILTFIGLPFFMFIINLLMQVGRRLLPVAGVLEQRTAHTPSH